MPKLPKNPNFEVQSDPTLVSLTMHNGEINFQFLRNFGINGNL